MQARQALKPNDAVIVAALRTPVGRAHKRLGYYRDMRADALAVATVRAILERTKIDPALIEDVVIGVSGQRGEQGFNLARMVAILAGLPFDTAGTTCNRLCGSSLQAINQAAHAIQYGAEDIQIVGGVEHMYAVPMENLDFVNQDLFARTPPEAFVMGNTAENLAQAKETPRRTQDEFALRSHQKATAAMNAGEFKPEIIPITVKTSSGETVVENDQCIRPDTSMEQLTSLTPAFRPDGGSITAGNSSPLNDGAAALLMMSAASAKRLGYQPMARVVSSAVAGVDPRLMGTGPIPASRKAMARAGLTVDDIDLFEINEAFAVQALVCRDEIGIPDEKLNIRGGALALGHPIGASGARISVTLLHALRDRKARYGLASLCVGMGQGVATVFERIED